MKLAIITGASSGIGLSTAKLFMDKGYEVINSSRKDAPLEGIVNINCNLSYESTISELIEKIEPYIKKATQVCLVHNAAKSSNDTADDCDIDALKMSLAVNVLAPSMLNRGLIHILPPSSSVIYIGSTLSEVAVPQAYSYITTKHAITGMMRATCQDLSGMNIHTACICPGYTNTKMLEASIPDDGVRQAVSTRNAFSRVIEPEEIAELVLFAHENPVVNGSMLHANLGHKTV